MEPAVRTSTIEQIHARRYLAVIAITGGGSGVIADLLRVPGASRTVLEAVVPYAAEALADWLGAAPESYCSSRTARAMAMVAYQRAWSLTASRVPRPPVLGLACTASLASDRPKRGEHRAYWAWQTAEVTVAGEIILRKGARSRAQEEDLLALLLLLTLDQATQQQALGSNPAVSIVTDAALVSDHLRTALGMTFDEHLAVVRQTATANWQRLLAGELKAVGTGPGSERSSDSRPRSIFPGAFNPRHAGHIEMARLASERLGRPVEYEISIANVDKPPLDYLEMADRQRQFGAGETLWFTHAPTFVEKSRSFPGSVFIVGADTIARIGEPRYYSGATADMQEAGRNRAITEIAGNGCRFLVFGRLGATGFSSLESIEIPPQLRALCEGVGEKEFRADVSSTALRREKDENER